MGANLHRVAFREWLGELSGPGEREELLRAIREHLSEKICVDAWNIVDEAYPRLGSYGAYDIFRHSLFFVHAGNFNDETFDGADLEPAAKEAFEKQLRPASDGIHYAATILDAGDTDTLFIPPLFESPLQYGDEEETIFVTSLPGAMQALEGFAEAVEFDLNVEFEPEFVDEEWQPLATCRNIARIMYKFFAEEQNACVALG